MQGGAEHDEQADTNHRNSEMVAVSLPESPGAHAQAGLAWRAGVIPNRKDRAHAEASDAS